MFCVVTFTTENESVDYVCENWLIGRNMCLWPNRPLKIMKQLRSSHCDPDKENWVECPVRVMKWSIGILKYFNYINN